jgi:hypothetical protein
MCSVYQKMSNYRSQVGSIGLRDSRSLFKLGMKQRDDNPVLLSVN